MAANPPTPMEVIAASLPPQIITSASFPLDDLEGVANGVCARGASGARGLVRPLGVVADANVSGGEIDDRRRNKKRRNAARATFEAGLVFALDDVEPADAGADVDPNPFGDVVGNLQAGGGHRLRGRGHRQVNEPRHLLRFLAFDEVQGIEVLHLRGDLAGVLFNVVVEIGDSGNTAFAGQQVGPHFVHRIADSANQPQSGNNNAATQSYLPPFAWAWM